MIREIAEFCPEATIISRALVLHIMETTKRNLICPYHHFYDKRGKVYDHEPEDNSTSRHYVTGTPYCRQVNSGRGKKSAVKSRVSGYFHCGCIEDDVLLDFYWWKLGTITSPATNITEGWGVQYLDPRARSFMCEQWRTWTLAESIDTELYRERTRPDVATVERLRRTIQRFEEELEAAQEIVEVRLAREKEEMELRAGPSKNMKRVRISYLDTVLHY